jgi:hypothetical protein
MASWVYISLTMCSAVAEVRLNQHQAHERWPHAACDADAEGAPDPLAPVDSLFFAKAVGSAIRFGGSGRPVLPRDGPSPALAAGGVLVGQVTATQPSQELSHAAASHRASPVPDQGPDGRQ